MIRLGSSPDAWLAGTLPLPNGRSVASHRAAYSLLVALSQRPSRRVRAALRETATRRLDPGLGSMFYVRAIWPSGLLDLAPTPLTSSENLLRASRRSGRSGNRVQSHQSLRRTKCSERHGSSQQCYGPMARFPFTNSSPELCDFHSKLSQTVGAGSPTWRKRSPNCCRAFGVARGKQ